MKDKPLGTREACKVIGELLRQDGRPITPRTLSRYKRSGLPYINMRPNVFRENELRRWVDAKKRGMWL